MNFLDLRRRLQGPQCAQILRGQSEALASVSSNSACVGDAMHGRCPTTYVLLIFPRIVAEAIGGHANNRSQAVGSILLDNAAQPDPIGTISA